MYCAVWDWGVGGCALTDVQWI